VALELVLTDSSLKAKLVQQGIERAATYTWRRAAQQLLDVYCRVGAS
jgi:glycosyltransferase involved in cell wall biosynthesis